MTNEEYMKSLTSEQLASFILSDLPIYRSYKEMLAWLLASTKGEPYDNEK